jgi:hypothetical protein|tara:strand:+ start:681 stop:881 length:201 start_codon:yes stop_codon:yes gene_type:complete
MSSENNHWSMKDQEDWTQEDWDQWQVDGANETKIAKNILAQLRKCKQLEKDIESVPQPSFPPLKFP